MIYNDPMFWPRKKPQKVTLTMTGEGDANECYIQIGGTKYYSAQTLEVEEGTEVYCYVPPDNVNGEIWVNGKATPYVPYTHTATKNAEIAFSYSTSFFLSCSISITEES